MNTDTAEESLLVTIQTKNFGEMQVHEKQKIIFPEGILGFEFINDYFLLDMDDSPFYCLQAENERDIAFILIQPDFFMPDYKLMISETDLNALEIKAPDEILDFAIVTIPEKTEEMTANLQGPVVINRTTRCARQIISLNDGYSVRHPILAALQAGESGGG